MIILSIIGTALCAALFSRIASDSRVLKAGNILAQGLIFVLSLVLAWMSCRYPEITALNNNLRCDSLSAFFVFIIALVNLAAIVYSGAYMAEDTEEGPLTFAQVRTYYTLFNLFSFSMFLVVLLDNLGHMWVAVEMTTLASAFLVGFYNNKSSVEAAWKYVIICSVGLTLALLGIVFLYYAAWSSTGLRSLSWVTISGIADKLDHKIIMMSFLLIFIGYGTKAGIVPMHTWLPDAHSQAFTPVSALLSGVLLKASLYAMIRFGIIANKCLGGIFSSHLFIFFGLFSVAVAAIFLLIQKDIKRMLAYSSIEHIGIIVFGLGLGTPLAVFGALLHVLNHALTKSIMFFAAGNIVKDYKTHNMRMMRGFIQVSPFTALITLVGLFSLIGMPPFAIFVSKLMIILAAFQKGAYVQGGLLLLFIALAFGALLFHISKIIFGRRPHDLKPVRERLSTKIVFLFLAVFILILGIVVPRPLYVLVEAAAKIITGA